MALLVSGAVSCCGLMAVTPEHVAAVLAFGTVLGSAAQFQAGELTGRAPVESFSADGSTTGCLTIPSSLEMMQILYVLGLWFFFVVILSLYLVSGGRKLFSTSHNCMNPSV